MTYNPNPQNQGWVTCRTRLGETIGKWKPWSPRQSYRGAYVPTPEEIAARELGGES